MAYNIYDLLINNPLSQTAINITKSVVSSKPKVEVPKVTIMECPPLWKLAQRAGPCVRIGGISGASAVVIGAIGAHRKLPDSPKDDLRKIFNTANSFHLLHSVALLTLPLCRRPLLSGTFFLLGLTLFCGTCYYHAFTGDKRFNQLTPVGGSCFILGWLTMVL